MENNLTDYSSYSILVVDDIPVNVLLVKSILSRLNFKLSSAGNGQEALEAVDKSMPDVILMDVMMPGMNGFEVTRALKQNPKTSMIPVIFLSALNSDSDIKTGFDVGANDFITKPFIPERIINSIKNQINFVENRKLKKLEEKKTLLLADKGTMLLSYLLCSKQEMLTKLIRRLVLSFPLSVLDDKFFQILQLSVDEGEDANAINTYAFSWVAKAIDDKKLKIDEVYQMETIYEIIGMLFPVTREKKITWSVHLDENIRISTDLELYKSLMSDLLVCACDINKENEISISGNVDGDKLLINISGNSNDEIDPSWEFNLSLAKEIATKLGGNLWTKQMDSAGFSVQLTLPL